VSEEKKYINPLQYIYQYKDHLGNIRLSYSDSDGNGTISQSEIIEENNYYPFGMLQKGYNSNVSANGNSTAQKKKYNGKELQNELGLNWYDYGARNYQPDLGRWMSTDPLADKYFSLSPYNYAGNAPTRFVDFDGQDFGIRIDLEKGTITISQTFYTNGSSKSKKFAKKMASYFSKMSGKFGLKTKDGSILKINFEINVSDEEGEMVEEDSGIRINSNRLKAEGDDEANFLSNSGSLKNIFGVPGLTLQGGDNMQFCSDCKKNDDESVDSGIIIHENFHALGASHDVTGKTGEKLNSYIIGATLLFASKSSRKLKINLRNQSFGFLSRKTKGLRELAKRDYGSVKSNLPKVKVYNQKKVKLSGTIVQIK
jgi:RHS repeat-associated protein